MAGNTGLPLPTDQPHLPLTAGGDFFEDITLPGAVLRYYPYFLSEKSSSCLLNHLLDSTSWQQDSIRIAGRLLDVPRLQAWYGDPDSGYGYSGLSLVPLPWSNTLLQLKSRIEEITGLDFNSVLLNLYRDGNDSVAWHSDDEPELGQDPQIASLSLGANRNLELRPTSAGRKDKKVLALANGSLLVMGKGMQQNWQHRIPKLKGLGACRVNLTFRFIQRMA